MYKEWDLLSHALLPFLSVLCLYTKVVSSDPKKPKTSACYCFFCFHLFLFSLFWLAVLLSKQKEKKKRVVSILFCCSPLTPTLSIFYCCALNAALLLRFSITLQLPANYFCSRQFFVSLFVAILCFSFQYFVDYFFDHFSFPLYSCLLCFLSLSPPLLCGLNCGGCVLLLCNFLWFFNIWCNRSKKKRKEREKKKRKCKKERMKKRYSEKNLRLDLRCSFLFSFFFFNVSKKTSNATKKCWYCTWWHPFRNLSFCLRFGHKEKREGI